MLESGDPRSKEGLERILKEFHMAPSQRWGQNFLVAAEVFNRIADLAEMAGPDLPMLEIGPGVGGLTRTLLERGRRVVAIELDERTRPILTALQDQFPGQLEVVFGDALELSWAEVLRTNGMDRAVVVGNLPYYITAPLLGRLMDPDLAWSRAVFMVQQEVAERLLAQPGNRGTGTLSVLLRYTMDVAEGLSRVPPESFYPPPEVFSAVIQFIPHSSLPVDWDVFRWVVRAGFQHRRKMLRQSLAQAGGSPFSKNAWHTFLEQIGLSSSARAEALSLDDWVTLAQAMEQRSEAANDIREPHTGPSDI